MTTAAAWKRAVDRAASAHPRRPRAVRTVPPPPCLRDADLDYLRDPRSLRDLGPLRAAFREAAARGVDATALASSGRYFGGEALAVRVETYARGGPGGADLRVLADGRHRYLTAREAGAEAILARLVEYGPRGGVRSDRVAVVRLC